MNHSLASRPLFLTGFMGVGKSTVGALLARELGWRFVDSDQLIEQETGLTIAQIFQQRGEPVFRELERNVVRRVARDTPAVVSLGGGALLNPETLRAVRAAGTLVYLSASTESLYERLKDTAEVRPLLADLSAEARQERIQTMLEQRRPIYENAHVHVKTDGSTPADVVAMIRRQLEEMRP